MLLLVDSNPQNHRSIIPPLGGIDFSAILAILALQLLQSLFASSLAQTYASFGGF